MKFKKGDPVVVTVGKDKGRKGKVDKIFPKEHRVLIAGLNVYKRHVKKRDEKNPGGIIELARPMDVSKVVFVCPSCGQPTRLGYVIDAGEKVRICRKCERKV